LVQKDRSSPARSASIREASLSVTSLAPELESRRVGIPDRRDHFDGSSDPLLNDNKHENVVLALHAHILPLNSRTSDVEVRDGARQKGGVERTPGKYIVTPRGGRPCSDGSFEEIGVVTREIEATDLLTRLLIMTDEDESRGTRGTNLLQYDIYRTKRAMFHMRTLHRGTRI